MAKDIFPQLSDEDLIRFYNIIGDTLKENPEHKLDINELGVMSSVSKRKLTHHTKYKFGLPSALNAGRYN